MLNESLCLLEQLAIKYALWTNSHHGICWLLGVILQVSYLSTTLQIQL